MADPINEAIKRARALAKMNQSQNAPVKRPPSELDDTLGTVKVTLAYEKPANSDRSSNHQRDSYNSNNNNNTTNNDNKDENSRGSRGTRDQRDRGDDRESSYSGNESTNNPHPINNPYARTNSNSYNQPGTSNFMPGVLTGANAFPRGGGAQDEKIEIIIPHAVIGLVIGKGGENIKRIQNETGATVRVDPNTVDEKGNKVCTITGTKQAVDEARNQVSSVIDNAATNKRPRMQVEGGEQYRMKIPATRTGAIIGKGGETIKQIKQQSGCDIELDKTAKDSEESVFIIRGTQEKINKARALIEARLASPARTVSSKGVATGANAAPVAQFTDLPTAFPNSAAAAGQQQGSADFQAAWAAYFAQYSSVYGTAGAAQASAAAGLPYTGQNIIAPTTGQQLPQEDQSHGTQGSSLAQQPQQDYSEQWIQYYIASGRPDYAEQIVELRKQQQALRQQKDLKLST